MPALKDHAIQLDTVEHKLWEVGLKIPADIDEDTLGVLYDIAISANHQSDLTSDIRDAAARQGILIARVGENTSPHRHWL